MKRIHQTAFSVLTSFTVLSIGLASSALAETITVTRGPNGAAHQVKVDRIPQDAQVRSETPTTGFPNIVTRGSHGAAHIAKTDSDRDTTAQSSVRRQVITRGPNGAAYIAN
ncbi:hypothetical protein [Acaryochloris marina]|uniref:Uncharacterized protein n=1 Tax=Acaryochloris marina (strain MBIC 11017) TaxID=329726 RepID=A8ZR27_ACAM1|nr:hypothetical protein [Acaryochloris marina]ABW33463.1 hypothetical protein AM1_H0113 [Acaryochloris marina MBIC11017]